MAEFDQLRKRIVEDGDRVLFDEAVTCHAGGAYRAAYVFAWIAAAEGLLNKLDAMGAAQSDIGSFVATFRKDQDAGSGKDATLLDQAQKVGFVDTTEYKALNGVRELRNQYGHPTATAPTATVSAAAIELAVDAVLSKPALLAHGGARQLAERVGTDVHFIPDDADAIRGWTAARASLIADAARPVFIRTLIEKHASSLGQVDEVLAERCRIVAATALAEWGADLSQQRWGVDALAQAHGASAAAVFTSAGAWELLSEPDRYQLLSRCLEVPSMTSEPNLTRRLLTRAFELHAAGALNETEEQLVATRVEAIDGTWLLAASAPVDLVLAKATGFLKDGYFTENQKGTQLLGSIPKAALADADPTALANAGAALARAYRNGARVARNLFSSVVAKPSQWPLPFRVAAAVDATTEPWLFWEEGSTRQAMRLALQDRDVAVAVRAAMPETVAKDDGVGFKADEVIAQIRERIESPGDGDLIDAAAVPVVVEILDLVERHHKDIYPDD